MTNEETKDGKEDAEFKKMIVFFIIVCYIVFVLVLLFIELLNTWGTERQINYTGIFVYPIIAIAVCGLLLYLLACKLNQDIKNSSDDDTGYPMFNSEFRRFTIEHNEFLYPRYFRKRL